MANLLNVLKLTKIKNGKAILLYEDDIELIQKRLLAVLDDIISICNDNNIKYQLGGGSALGAIRHKGFIPWDDDIDININRAEINKFLILFKKEYGDKYWIHIPGETKNFDYLMIKIMTKDVRARALMDSDKIECGLCIDIFIIENAFNNPLIRKIHGIGCMVFRYILSCLRFKKNQDELFNITEDNTELKKYIKIRRLWATLFSIIPLDIWSKVSSKWMKLCSNNNSKFVAIPAGQHQYFKEMYNRQEYCELINVLFEERSVNVSKSYDAYLTNLYGSYMDIPPLEKREKHIMMELDRTALKNWTKK